MKPFEQFPDRFRKEIRYVLTDIDDTLTISGRLTSTVFLAVERLQKAGIRVILITGRPAGWCDHMARMWPVDGLVGENGAFFFRYDRGLKKMRRRYWKPEAERKQDRERLDLVKQDILKKMPGCRVASDQAFREADLAIDFCEDVPPLDMSHVEEILRCFAAAGAQAKVSSIHVNGWFGAYDKLAMTRVFFEEVFRLDLDEVKGQIIFSGDSPNDAPMFRYFPHSLGVANVLRFRNRMAALPAWVTKRTEGKGFAEMVDVLLA